MTHPKTDDQPIMAGIDTALDTACPIGDCGYPLHITWALSRPIFLNDTAADLNHSNGAYTETWQIGCEEGHVILLPVGADDTEQFGRDLDPDEDDRPHDMERLRKVLRAGGVIDQEKPDPRHGLGPEDVL